MEQIIRRLEADRDAYFYRTHGGAELDLLIFRGGKRHGFEMKYADAPTMTRSMWVALEDLRLDSLWVVYPGKRSYRLSERVATLPLATVSSFTL